MPPKDLNLKLNTHIAKKEMYFNKIQRLYDLSQDLNNENNLKAFRIEINTLEQNITLFKQTIDDINEINLEINREYILNYQPIATIDTMHCHIMEAAKVLDVQGYHNKQVNDQSAVAKLQKLDIPEFSGDPRRWPIFCETFKSLVHNTNLDNISKTSYLLGALKGKALDACAGILPTPANYQILWETLVNKYEDKRMLADTYFTQIMEFKPAQQESAAFFNNFFEKFDNSVKAIKQLGISDLADFIIASIALSKLDIQTRKLFEMTNTESEFPIYSEIVDFIKIQRKALNTVQKNKHFDSAKPSKYSSGYREKSVAQTFVSTSGDRNDRKNKRLVNNCPICNQSHLIFHCSDFLKLAPSDKYNIVKEKKLCLNCLSSRHKIVDCKSNNVCNTCKKKHHSFLHFTKTNNTNQDTVASTSSCQFNSNENVADSGVTQNFCSISTSKIVHNNYTTLLSTAVVNIKTGSGEYKPARFLIDSGSQAHFITRNCCQRLNLSFTKHHFLVNGIGGSQKAIGHLDFVLHSRFDLNTQFQVHALVVEKITDELPKINVPTNSLNYLQHLQLADNQFYKPSKIDGIIGANLFLHILGTNRVYGPPSLPVAMQTSLGYIVMGNVPIINAIDSCQTFCSLIEPSIEQTLHKFWELEEIPTPSVLNADEVECENIFKTTTIRNANGQYVVTLPFREYPPALGNSFDMACKRFYSLENKFKNSPQLKNNYCDVINDYLNQGHMFPVSLESHSIGDNNSYYIPHFAVFKNSTSTPLRIVFDASAKSSNSRSLNDVLYSGPKLQTDIFKLLLNFRLFEIGMISDIRQMYRNIWVSPDHRKYQRILWRSSPGDKLSIFELHTVVFGITSSPFSALRTIKQLARDEAHFYPLAAKIVDSNLYIDDLVVSVPTVVEATELYRQLVGLFSAGGFALVKWVTNSQDLLQNIPENIRLSKNIEFIESEIHALKVLGLQWDPLVDAFSFVVNISNTTCTKRNILSTLARIWDPLGFLSAVTFYAKIIIKELWLSKIDWDDEPPEYIKKMWSKFYREIPLLSRFKVPRYIGADRIALVTLIGFCDSSTVGYGAIVYTKIVTRTGSIRINLMCAKSKVAPVKICTIPRLELCAAVLLAKLIKTVLDSCSSLIRIENIYTFSDSTVVLNWIGNSPHKWKTFVANRVSKIQTSVPNANWFHIEGKNNIADCLSRGLTPAHLLEQRSWVCGPDWLSTEIENWPIRKILPDLTLNVEEKIIANFFVTNIEDNTIRNLMLRLSSWTKLCRITVYILRFLKILPIKKYIAASDLERAEIFLIRIVQKIHFANDYTLLQKKSCSKSLRYLQPFLEDDCIKVGGRLKNANISHREKHPLLLPKRDHVVDMLIDHFHRLYLHTGPHLLLSLLRQRYWILSARSTVRNRIKKCVYCYRFKPKSIFPQMADLPTVRVTQAKPFFHCGVDYAGPFHITMARRRGNKGQKAYVCLFVCFTTKAIHLELASDMTTATFLGCFKRFIARRGPVSCLYSDCGTNFIGAKGELDDIYKLAQSSEYINAIGTQLGLHQIEWKFNPPSAPHFGGIWESNVKSMKTHLYKVIGNQILSYEEFNTVLTQIEALLNSRPLCWLSSDPSEPMALTPAHFLTLTPSQSLPANDYSSEKISLLSRKELLDQLVQSFWKRWHLEYLSGLQSRQKWNTTTCPITKGTVVLIKQENTPPLHWPLGIIENVFPGQDGVIRVAQVRAKNTSYKRPIVKLCPLPSQ